MMSTRMMALSCAVSGLALTACVQQSAEPSVSVEAAASVNETAKTKKPALAAPYTTVKPGASVTFSHDLIEAVEVGANGAVTLTINEGYPDGTLRLEASGQDGLEVFGAETSATKDMSLGTTHQWRIDFRGDADGVHYLNVLATAEPTGGITESRAYAVRVNVGDWKTAQAAVQSATAPEMMLDGEPAVIMEAEETIE